MEDATNRHSQYLAASALREAATPCPVPLVARVHNRTPSGKQKEGLLPTGKNFFGFIADTCHHSYRSNGKSTSLAATAPEETTSIHPPASGGRLGWGPPHPDTDSLRQDSAHRYPSLMEDAIHRHSHDLAASALREPAGHCPVPTARVHDRTPSGKQKEGLLPTGENFFGFIAATCHHSYRSNGKSTSLAATAPEETTSLHPPESGGRLGSGRPHPATTSLPLHSAHRYPSPMEDAINRRSHDLAASALREAATPCPVPMVARVHNRTPSGKQKEGLLPTGENFLGFIAETCHSSYRSNGKSTSLAATAPEETTSLHPLSGCDLSNIAKNAHARLTLPRALYAHAACVDTGNGAA